MKRKHYFYYLFQTSSWARCALNSSLSSSSAAYNSSYEEVSCSVVNLKQRFKNFSTFSLFLLHHCALPRELVQSSVEHVLKPTK